MTRHQENSLPAGAKGSGDPPTVAEGPIELVCTQQTWQEVALLDPEKVGIFRLFFLWRPLNIIL